MEQRDNEFDHYFNICFFFKIYKKIHHYKSIMSNNKIVTVKSGGIFEIKKMIYILESNVSQNSLIQNLKIVNFLKQNTKQTIYCQKYEKTFQKAGKFCDEILN